MDLTPNGNEVWDFTPSAIPKEVLAAVGLLTASSSFGDSVVGMAIAGLLGIDGEQGYAVTAHMPNPLRMSVVRSAAEIRIQMPEVLDELDRLLNVLKGATDARNTFVHGSLCIKPSTKEVFIVTQEARTHVVIEPTPVSVAEIELKASAVYNAGLALMSFLVDHGLVPALPRQRLRGVNTPKERKKRRGVSRK